MTRPQLVLDLRAHDLPPSWDGRAVTWDPWQVPPPAFLCPPPRPACCPSCASLTQRRPFCVGWVGGRRRLWAWRCPDCRHDQVLDRADDLLWELDESDYGDRGSRPTTATAGPVRLRRRRPRVPPG